jgi:hypothetical protein
MQHQVMRAIRGYLLAGVKILDPTTAIKWIKSAAAHYLPRLPKRYGIGAHRRPSASCVHLLFHDGDEWMYANK